MRTVAAVETAVQLFRGYNPHPKAWKFFKDNRRYCLATCGRRSAKSHTGARRFMRRVFEDLAGPKGKTPYDPGAARRGTALWWDRRPRLHYWVCAHENEQLDEPRRYILEVLPPELLDHADNSKGRLWLHGDILIEFKTLHDPKQKVGSGLDGIWIEEAARVRADAWQGFVNFALADREGWAQFTTTPLGKDWTYSNLYLKSLEDPENYGFHTWFMSDNIRVPAIVAYDAEMKRTLPPAYYKRECRASYDAFIGQIYEDFDPGRICPDKFPMVTDDLPRGVQLVKRIGTQDWGFTAPGAQVVLGSTNADPNKAALWAIDEVYSTSQLVEDFWAPSARALNAKHKMNEWVADPAEPDNLERMKRVGIRMTGHKNYMTAKFDEHERSVRAGIRMLASLIYQGRFHITRKCPNLLSEIESYRWADAPGGGGGVTDANPRAGLQEKPAPGQKEHAATAARYGVTYLMKGARFEALQGMAA